VHRRHQHINIPTEIIRTLAAIAETGSFTKAGDKLGLSQPAISAQVKRLQVLVGGPVFNKHGGGIALTDRGRLALDYARRLLNANDQILALGGTMRDGTAIRIGLSNVYVEPFLRLHGARAGMLAGYIQCDTSPELERGLSNGYLDAAVLVNPPNTSARVVAEWRESFAWMRARDFVLSPGAAIPLIGWPGSIGDQIAIDALEGQGLSYKFVFACLDHRARISAAAAGLGVTLLPLRNPAEPLIVARDHYLPPLSPVRACVCVRAGSDRPAMRPLLAMLSALAPAEPAPVASARRA
jgi:DNA-binding transcriptional LysR family regulator